MRQVLQAATLAFALSQCVEPPQENRDTTDLVKCVKNDLDCRISQIQERYQALMAELDKIRLNNWAGRHMAEAGYTNARTASQIDQIYPDVTIEEIRITAEITDLIKQMSLLISGKSSLDL